MPKLSIEIDLQGAEEVARQLADIGEAGQKAFEDITKAAEEAGGFAKLDPSDVLKRLQEFGNLSVDQIEKIQGAINKLSFDEATKSIAGLGKTSQEAFENAAKAAEKFGASQTDIARVDTLINSLAARSRDGGKTFEDLAQSYDKARNSIATTGVGLATAAQGLRVIEQAALPASRGIAGLTQAVFDLRLATIALRPAAAELGTSFSFLGTLFRAGGGPAGAIAAAIGAVSALEIAFTNAADKAKVLQQRLTDALRTTPGGGARAFSELQDSANRTGSDVDSLASSFLKLKGAMENARSTKVVSAPGTEPFDFGGKQALTFLENLQKVGQAAGQSAETTDKAISNLVNDIAKLGPAGKPIGLTGDAFRRLEEASPSMARALQEALQRGGQSAERFARELDTTKKSLDSLIRVGPAIKPTVVGPDVRTLRQSTDDFKKALTDLSAAAGKRIGIDPSNIDAATAKIREFTKALKEFDIPAWLKSTSIWDAFKAAGIAAWDAINEKGKDGSPSWLESTSIWDAFIAAGKAAWDAINKSGEDGSPSWLQSTSIWDAFVAAGTAAWDTISRAAEAAGLPEWLKSTSIWDAFVSAGTAAWDTISAAGVSALDAILAKVQQIIALLSQLKVPTPQEQASFGGGMAGGGLVGGRGTGTSDSNLAWLSRGEHVMPAVAVAQPGVLSFLEALRRSGGNLTRVLDGMGRFALGGLIMPRMVPAFATGGLVGNSMHPVTIHFPGVPPISGLRASADTVSELQRAAAMAQVRSGGRKPSRYS